jgi:putative transferase (TIGR04331 family)
MFAMFLITTADTRSWQKDNDEEILFLGDWCLRYDLRDRWHSMNYRVLPYHWDDRQRLFQDHKYLETLHKQFFDEMVESFNHIHGTKHSKRYWQIIFGFWLRYFLDVLYDRYLSIRLAIDSRLVTSTLILDNTVERCIPHDMNEFTQSIHTDAYNHNLYGDIIQQLGGIPFKVTPNDSTSIYTKRVSTPSFSLKSVVIHMLRAYSKLIPQQFNQVMLWNSYLGNLDIMRMQLALKQLPNPVTRPVPSVTMAPDMKMRDQLQLPNGTDEFSRLASTMLMKHLPTIYLEGYCNMLEKSQQEYPAAPTVLVSSCALLYEEGSKFLGARCVDKGGKLVIIQHGGHYGTGLWCAQENHEIAISDQYLTWGWTIPSKPSVTPFYSSKLNSQNRLVSPDPSGRILLIECVIPRYSYRMYSIPAGPQIFRFIEEQALFLQHLPEKIRSLLVLRGVDGDPYKIHTKERLQESGIEIDYCGNSVPMLTQLNDCRICISTYNATVFLETLSANYPTLMFWNPKWFELRPDAEPFFDELRRVGILHDSPELAAAKLIEIIGDIDGWWLSTEVQTVRNSFCQQYARTSEDWFLHWYKTLAALA